jgi:hypothetical protein
VDVPIRKPVFLVSLPRSGSWVFYRKLARHPELGWISKATRKAPASLVVSRLLRPFRGPDVPVEGSRIWRRFAREQDDTLGPEDMTDADRAWLRRMVATQLRLQGKPRFLSKYPRNGLRIGWLDAAFPDALFVHLVRDARAVVRSILDRREHHGGLDTWWGSRPRGWRELASLPPVEQAAHQWRLCVEQAQEAARALGPGRYLEVRYEDFCDAPRETLEKTAAFCELQWPAGMLDELVRDVRSQNFKWRERLAPEEAAAIERIAGARLAELGYSM